MKDGVPEACTLSGPQLLQRRSEWAEVTAQATTRRVESDRIVSTYHLDPVLVQRLKKLIAAEAECCSFMSFDLDEGPSEVVVELRVPQGMGPGLAELLGTGR